MKLLTGLLFSLTLLISGVSTAEETKAYRPPDTISVDVPSTYYKLKFTENKGNTTLQSAAFAVYAPLGKLNDITTQHASNPKEMRKQILKLIKEKVPAVCEIYYNPSSPNFDGNEVLIQPAKKVSLQALGLPAGIAGGKPPKPGVTMGTFVSFKYVLPNGPNGYILTKFLVDDSRFDPEDLQGSLNVRGAYDSYIAKNPPKNKK